ncbi:pantoate--beta-alanine ligase [Deltaproteobacteria bacterium Smac51]|nr:pantoate--beta-alanine ligase [Deltaproteobacteria bacterium Smac51]
MKVFSKIDELREELLKNRQNNASIGLVPTMGALHDGHASLLRAACAENDYVVVSLFVNPTQFAPTEDLAAYPRTFEADCRLAEEIGAKAMFAPTPEEMYPEGDSTWVEVTGHLTAILCGKSRPTHFRGVTTVVAKLLNIVGPCKAYFGQKDGQQAQVVRRMVRDLFIPAEIRIMPIIRENDGLAMSSRNAYLSEDDRAAALVLSRSLNEAEELIKNKGLRDREEILSRITAIISDTPQAQLDYAEIYSFPDLEEIDHLEGEIFIALAVRFGGARLIDNLVVSI